MFKLAVLIPLLSIIIVGSISIGLGVLFILLELYTPLHQWGSAIVGMGSVSYTHLTLPTPPYV